MEESIMNSKRIYNLAHISIGILFAIGLAMILFFYPYQTGLFGVIHGYRLTTLDIFEVVIYYSCSIACFVILFIFLKGMKDLKKDGLYSHEAHKKLQTISLILLISSSIFFLFNLIATIIIKLALYEATYIIIGALGIVLSLTFQIICNYWKGTILLKEDNDTII